MANETYAHLPLIQENVLEERKFPPGRGAPTFRGNRGGFGADVARHLRRVEEERSRQPAPPQGFNPHLILRIPFAKGVKIPREAVTALFEDNGYTIVSMEADRAIVAFRSDGDLRDFREIAAGYSRGPAPGINPKTGKPYQGTKWDALEFIDPEGIASWTRRDRVGPRLAAAIGEDGQRIQADATYRLDVELWHTGSAQEVRNHLEELRRALSTSQQARIFDEYTGRYMCVVRVLVTGPQLDGLLNAPAIAGVEFPPEPRFDAARPLETTMRQLEPVPAPPEDGPRVCIIDSGVATNHPLLQKHVGNATAILTRGTTPADEHGHGTLVGGVAVFGDIHAAFHDGSGFRSDVTLLSARVLNAEKKFDEDVLIIKQLERAIRTYAAAPYNCKVFNLSLGSDRPSNELLHDDRQTLWAASLDTLARELGVLLVVSAGNYEDPIDAPGVHGEAAFHNYPRYLLEPKARLADPATAAIAVTVGSLAQHTVSALEPDDTVKHSVAGDDEPSPFTRAGPGVQGAIKPEFVHYGGNLIFGPAGGGRATFVDDGVSVLSLSHRPTESLFAYDVGTSLAAPRVANIAARVWRNLEKNWSTIFGTTFGQPSANLVRAVLANAATLPEAALKRLADVSDDAVRRLCGYGMPSEDNALYSSKSRVTLVAQGSVEIDRFHVYEVPLPAEILSQHGKKTITVSLAFDPPVRPRRQPYLGVTMTYYLVRGATLDEIKQMFGRPQGEAEDATEEAEDEGDTGGKKMEWDIGSRTRSKCTLQSARTSLTKVRPEEETYYLVVRSERKWAPDSVQRQNFGVAVTIECENDRLYELVEQRVRLRLRQRARV